ncbi:hypothetical protein SCP_1801400 [Sparassis crispa]|uniref:Uncharacterized protein n=1 Tax=Sparassis crispa TaxID=139825 RepID=A0A401H6P3_9APHY|nr:hypothetical protein SCP_1801400 [Sparassis crispa]GBE90116.1 hypothetical protein SCP_1801400 [Sparassis crispa]
MRTTSHVFLYEDSGYNLDDVAVVTDDYIKKNMTGVIHWLVQANDSPFFNIPDTASRQEVCTEINRLPLGLLQNGQTVDVVLHDDQTATCWLPSHNYCRCASSTRGDSASPGVSILDSLVDSQYYGSTFASGLVRGVTR